MRTSMDLNDALLIEAKRLAAERGTSLKAVVEDGLRAVLGGQLRDRQPAAAWPIDTRSAPVTGVDLARSGELLERTEDRP